MNYWNGVEERWGERRNQEADKSDSIKGDKEVLCF